MAENWKIKLIEAHRRLFKPPKGRPEASPGYPACEEGWRDLLERACSRIEAALGRRNTFRVAQIKEKFGTLRFYWDGRFSEKAKMKVEEAIALAEARSACTCEICGAEGRLHNRGGWYATRCAEHAEGKPVPVKPSMENVHIVHEVSGIGVGMIRRRYDRETDGFVEISRRSDLLRVTIEIWPGGDETRARAIAVANVANISDLSDVSDYAVSVTEQYNPIADTPGWSARGSISEHNRGGSVWALIAKVATWAAEEATKKDRGSAT